MQHVQFSTVFGCRLWWNLAWISVKNCFTQGPIFEPGIWQHFAGRRLKPHSSLGLFFEPAFLGFLSVHVRAAFLFCFCAKNLPDSRVVFESNLEQNFCTNSVWKLLKIRARILDQKPGSCFWPSPYVVIKSVPGKRALKLDRFWQEFHIFVVKMLQDL